MSYILEALKRAEAERERERGAVPGLHAQPLAAAESAAAPSWVRPAVWAGGGAVIVLAGVLAWRWHAGADGAPPPPASQQLAMARPPAAMPAVPAPAPMPSAATTAPPAPAAAPASPPTAVPAGPAVVSPLAVNAPVGVRMTPAPGFVPYRGPGNPTAAGQAATPAPPVARTAVPAAPPPVRPALPPRDMPAPTTPARDAGAQRQATAAPAPVMPAPAPMMPTRAPAAAPSPAAGPVPSPAATPSPAANDHVYASATELPGDARGGVPPLAIGGSIYSPNPAARFIVINGQVLHEGDEVANGLKLEKIELKSAVLNYKGYRFRVGY